MVRRILCNKSLEEKPENIPRFELLKKIGQDGCCFSSKSFKFGKNLALCALRYLFSEITSLVF